MLPVRKGELQCAFLGMDMDTVDDEGNPVEGGPGELICRNAHLSMPLFFGGMTMGSVIRMPISTVCRNLESWGLC